MAEGPGRPKADIDWEYVGKLLEAGCKAIDIANEIGINRETFYNRCEADNNIGFSAFSQERRSKGDNRLRVAQYKNAIDGNTSMQIWLGKDRLGQKDQQEISASLTVNTINYADADIPDTSPQVQAEELPDQGDESLGSRD